MESLVSLCGDLLLELEFSTDTCLQLFVLASSCELNLLLQYVVPFIAENFQTVKQQEHFFDLPSHLLCRILSEPCLDVPDERQVLDVVLKWLHRGKERLRFAAQLLKCVRWTTMELSAQEWRQLKKDEAISSNEESFGIVQQAIVYSISPAHRWSLMHHMTKPRPSTEERHVLATVDFYGACIWMEEEEKWLQTKFRVQSTLYTWLRPYADMYDSVYEGMYETYHRYPNNEVICYDRRLFMALWSLRKLLYCEDLLAGRWKEVCEIPWGAENGPLIVAPGCLYIFGNVKRSFHEHVHPEGYFQDIGPLPVYRLDVSSCCSTPRWKPEGKWEEAPPVPRATSVSFGFHLDNKIFLFEKEVIYGSTICPKSMSGVHVFYIDLQEWRNLDDPREDWQNNKALKRVQFKSHHPVFAEGKVYLTTSKMKICVLDLATMQLDMEPSVRHGPLTTGFMTFYDGKVVWVEDEKLAGFSPATGKRTHWSKMPMLEYPQCLVVPVQQSQLESAWNGFLSEYNGKKMTGFCLPKDYTYNRNCRWSERR